MGALYQPAEPAQLKTQIVLGRQRRCFSCKIKSKVFMGGWGGGRGLFWVFRFREYGLFAPA